MPLVTSGFYNPPLVRPGSLGQGGNAVALACIKMNRLSAILPASQVLVDVDASSKSASSSTRVCCLRISIPLPERR